MDTPGDRFLTLSLPERATLWRDAVRCIEDYIQHGEDLPLLRDVDVPRLRQDLEAWSFNQAHPVSDTLQFVADGMIRGQLHTSHPCYYGVFNPRPATAGVVGDMLASAFNTQLASFTSAAFAIEVEQYVLREFGRLFGYIQPEGVFTSGGTEANHTALLAALTWKFPTWNAEGAFGLPGRPVLYVSSETHHSFLKAARMSGLGAAAVREIPATVDYCMDVAALEDRIRQDREAGLQPFFVVATIGSTAGGIVDPVAPVAAVAQREGLWLHLDAAWGGAAILIDELKYLFDGSDVSDSFTLDAHKWFSVPMTAGLFVTRHGGILERTFRVDKTSYMPAESATSARFQPYAQSMAWSRRFLGLKVFMALSVAGWDGYAATLRHQIDMGRLLRAELERHQWTVLNPTPLPVACFVDAGGQLRADDIERFAAAVAETGKTWITTTHLGLVPALRAGIANSSTQARHIQTLMEVLDAAREQMARP